MTLQYVSDQLHELTGGRINGLTYTRQELRQVLRIWMRGAHSNKIPDTVVIEVTLPDGRWFAAVSRYADRADGYDYYIPDTREQEAELLEKLLA